MGQRERGRDRRRGCREAATFYLCIDGGPARFCPTPYTHLAEREKHEQVRETHNTKTSWDGSRKEIGSLLLLRGQLVWRTFDSHVQQIRTLCLPSFHPVYLHHICGTVLRYIDQLFKNNINDPNHCSSLCVTLFLVICTLFPLLLDKLAPL